MTGTAFRLFSSQARIQIWLLEHSFPLPADNGKESTIPLLKLRPRWNFSPTVAGLYAVINTSHHTFLMHYKTNLPSVKFATLFPSHFLTGSICESVFCTNGLRIERKRQPAFAE